MKNSKMKNADAVLDNLEFFLTFDLVILPDCKLSHQEITIIVQNAFDKSFPEYYTVINFDSAYTFL